MQENLGNIAPAPDDKKEERLAVAIVPVEELIPDIKPQTKADNSFREREATNHFTDVFSDSLFQFQKALGTRLSFELTKAGDGEGLKNLDYGEGGWGRIFKDKIVVDLCAGWTPYGYIFAALYGAKGYVGVDKYDSEALLEQLDEIDKALKKLKNKSNGYINISKEQLRPTPAAIVNEDVLSFLERLPKDSVSFLSSGNIGVFTDSDGKYVRSCNEQISRALNPNGIIVANESLFDGEDTEKLVNESGYLIARKKKKNLL